MELFESISMTTVYIYFFCRTLETKVSLKKQIIFGLIFIFINLQVSYIHYSLHPYFVIIICVIYSSVVFYGIIKEYIIWPIAIVALDGVIEMCLIGLYILIPNTNIIQLTSNIIIHIVAIIVSKSVLSLFIYLVTKKIDKTSIIISKYINLFIVFAICCLVIVYILFIYRYDLEDNNIKLLLFLISTILLAMLSSVISLYNGIIADAKQISMSKLKLKTIEMTQVHTNEVNNIYDKLSKIKHDLNNHFTAINGYVNAKDFDALTMYMKNLGQFDLNINLYSRQPIINTLINNFACRAENENIKFSFDIQLPKEITLKDVDICILFGNILENAFEANKTVTDHKYVALNVCVNKFYWQIYCKNSNSTYKNIKTTDNLRTTKKSNEVHGIGTKQIKEIAETNGGHVDFSCKNYNFCTIVMIKLV